MLVMYINLTKANVSPNSLSIFEEHYVTEAQMKSRISC